MMTLVRVGELNGVKTTAIYITSRSPELSCACHFGDLACGHGVAAKVVTAGSAMLRIPVELEDGESAWGGQGA